MLTYQNWGILCSSFWGQCCHGNHEDNQWDKFHLGMQL